MVRLFTTDPRHYLAKMGHKNSLEITQTTAEIIAHMTTSSDLLDVVLAQLQISKDDTQAEANKASTNDVTDFFKQLDEE